MFPLSYLLLSVSLYSKMTLMKLDFKVLKLLTFSGQISLFSFEKKLYMKNNQHRKSEENIYFFSFRHWTKKSRKNKLEST